MGKNTGSNRTFEWIYIGESTFTDEDGTVPTIEIRCLENGAVQHFARGTKSLQTGFGRNWKSSRCIHGVYAACHCWGCNPNHPRTLESRFVAGAVFAEPAQ